MFHWLLMFYTQRKIMFNISSYTKLVRVIDFSCVKSCWCTEIPTTCNVHFNYLHSECQSIYLKNNLISLCVCARARTLCNTIQWNCNVKLKLNDFVEQKNSKQFAYYCRMHAIVACMFVTWRYLITKFYVSFCI